MILSMMNGETPYSALESLSTTSSKISKTHPQNQTVEGNENSTSTSNNNSIHNSAVDVGTVELYLVITNISKRANIRALLQTSAAFNCLRILVVGQKNFRFHCSDPLIASPTDTAAATASGASTQSTFDDDGDNSHHPSNQSIRNQSEITTTNSSSAAIPTTTTDLPSCLHASVFYTGTMSIERFQDWFECVSYLRCHDIRLIGVEIHPNAQTIEDLLSSSCHLHQRQQQRIAFCMGNEGTGLNEKQLKSCDAFCRIPQYGNGTASLNVYVAASIVLYRFHIWQRKLLLQQQKQSS